MASGKILYCKLQSSLSCLLSCIIIISAYTVIIQTNLIQCLHLFVIVLGLNSCRIILEVKHCLLGPLEFHHVALVTQSVKQINPSVVILVRTLQPIRPLYEADYCHLSKRPDILKYSLSIQLYNMYTPALSKMMKSNL